MKLEAQMMSGVGITTDATVEGRRRKIRTLHGKVRFRTETGRYLVMEGEFAEVNGRWYRCRRTRGREGLVIVLLNLVRAMIA